MTMESPLNTALAQLRGTIDKLGLSENDWQTLSTPRRVMQVAVPLRRDNGDVEMMGMKVVVVSDVDGAVTGFPSVSALWGRFLANKNLDLPGTDRLTNEELLHLEVEVLIPAALADAITESTAPGVKAKIVVEGANGPTTPQSDHILKDKGVLVVPDILANSGGVIVSYFEWVQDKQNYLWSSDEVKENLSSILMKAVREVEEVSTSKKVTWRDSALMIGVGRVAEAHHLRGLYP